MNTPFVPTNKSTRPINFLQVCDYIFIILSLYIVILFYVCFCLKKPYLTYIVGNITVDSQAAM